MNLIGDIYNNWTVIAKGESKIQPNGKIINFWKCICKCGTEKDVNESNLRSGLSKSCGCIGSAKTSKRNTKHGLAISHKKAFDVWNNLNQRCNNPKNPRYKDYGGRGIKVCERWHKFENFLADMGDPPNGMEIDRIDNNAGYSFENCRWTIKRINMNNRRNTLEFEWKGVVKPLSFICEECNASLHHVTERLKLGWTLEKALSTPINQQAGAQLPLFEK